MQTLQFINEAAGDKMRGLVDPPAAAFPFVGDSLLFSGVNGSFRVASIERLYCGEIVHVTVFVIPISGISERLPHED